MRSIGITKRSASPAHFIFFDKGIMALGLDIRIVEIEITHTPDLGFFTICFYFPDIGKVNGFDRGHILRLFPDRITYLRILRGF